MSIAGEYKVWRRKGDFGRFVESSFCPSCGVSVFFRAEGLPALVGVAAGCFADPDFVKPGRLYWASRRHHWLHLDENIPSLEQQPD